MSRILIPLDGSAPAEEAIRFAERKAGDELILVRVVDVAPYVSHNPIVTSDVLGGLQQDALDYLDSCRARLRPPVRAMLRVGHPVQEIVAVAEQEKIERIVMSSHGRTGLSRWLLGSVAENVCRQAPCPVWLIPKENYRDPALQSILIATDGSKLSEHGIEYALRLTERGLTPGNAVLFRATDVNLEDRSDKIARARVQMHASMLEHLEAVAEPLRQAGWQVTCRVDDGTAASKILDTAEEEGVDAIFLCTHGRTGWKRWVVGSVAEMVARYSTRPVVLINTAAVPALTPCGSG